MTKQTTKNKTNKNTTKSMKVASEKSGKKVAKIISNKSTTKTNKKVTQTKTKKSDDRKKTKKLLTIHNNNPKITKLIIFLFGILLIFSTYAWFSMNLNIKIKTLNLVVAKNNDFSISIDGINFDRSVELTKKNVFEDLGKLYPGYMTQWPSNGLIPVSSPGIPNSNTQYFDFFETNGVLYHKREKDRGFLTTRKSKESKPREYNYYLAFDIFIRNENNSPVSDNLYFETTTNILAKDQEDEELPGLVNSFRIGIVKIGTVGLNASVNEIQNIKCNNNCKSIIYEPNSKFHSALSIERAEKYGIKLVDGNRFPTYAYIKAGGPIYVENSVSGSSKIDREYFTVQQTIHEEDLTNPLFEIPNGITKARIYVWIEGQDIDSLETKSKGDEIELTIDFIKDMEGWTSFDEE